MVNQLSPGAGGFAAPPEARANPLRVRSMSRSRSKMLTHFGSDMDSAEARFDKMKEADSQIKAVIQAFGGMMNLADTVTTKDVVGACADIVAAGIPAVQMATILANMPEQPQQLQAWIKHEFEQAQTADQKIQQGLAITRHQMISAGLNSLIAHSAEAQMLAAPAAGNA